MINWLENKCKKSSSFSWGLTIGSIALMGYILYTTY